MRLGGQDFPFMTIIGKMAFARLSGAIARQDGGHLGGGRHLLETGIG